jgi:hypothetical protein
VERRTLYNYLRRSKVLVKWLESHTGSG